MSDLLYDEAGIRCIKAAPFAPSNVIAVTFSHVHDPGVLHRPFCAQLLDRSDINAVHILNNANDWYTRAESQRHYRAIFARIRSLPEYRSASARVGYGGSMGGHAVLRFRDELAVDRSVVSGPQYSIDPQRAPYEDRWRDDVKLCDFTRDRIPPIRPGEDIKMLYDPSEPRDMKHVELIDPGHHAGRVPFPFSTHTVEAFYKEVGLMTEVLCGLIRGDDVSASVQQAYARRRTSYLYMRQLAIYWADKMPNQSIWAIDQALLLSSDDPNLLVFRAEVAARIPPQPAPGISGPAESGSGTASGDPSADSRTACSAGPAPPPHPDP